MNNTLRQIKISTLFNILKMRPASLRVGIPFTLIPLILLIVFTIIFASLNRGYPAVDYELVNKKGQDNTARITGIVTQYNISINGIHPTILSYAYQKNGHTFNAQSRVLEGEKIDTLEVGNHIAIKEFKGQKIINGVKPYEFQTGFFLLLLLPLFLIGVPCLAYSLYHLRNVWRLYKFGEVQQARIISIISQSAFAFIKIPQNVTVHYEYEINGEKFIGESISTDLSIASTKAKGSIVPIFVSTDNSEKSCLVPELDARRNRWEIDFA